MWVALLSLREYCFHLLHSAAACFSALLSTRFLDGLGYPNFVVFVENHVSYMYVVYEQCNE